MCSILGCFPALQLLSFSECGSTSHPLSTLHPAQTDWQTKLKSNVLVPVLAPLRIKWRKISDVVCRTVLALWWRNCSKCGQYTAHSVTKKEDGTR